MRVTWNKFVFMAFDAPQPNLLTSPYSVRYDFLEKHVPKENILVKVAPYTICIGRDHLETISLRVAQEGEGVILRNPDAIYINGYSRYIFKHRGYQDAEALVLEKRPYGNSYLCRIHKQHLLHNLKGNAEAGNTKTQSENDQEGTDEEGNMDEVKDTNIENTPTTVTTKTAKNSEFYDIEMSMDAAKFEGSTDEITPGCFVSFYYSGEYSGVGPPLNPKIYAVRTDITSWEQIMHSKTPKLHQRIWKPPATTNDWSTTASQRKFFDNFAKESGFDPLVATNWYGIRLQDVAAKSGRGLLEKYNCSLMKALVTLYPEIGLVLHKFHIVPVGHWQRKDNIKKLFDDFAKERGFDPEVAQNWYSVEAKDIASEGAGALYKYNNNLFNALTDIYPTIGIEKHKFGRVVGTYWVSQETQRKYLDEYAKTKKFDPLQPENWYNIRSREIRSDKSLIAIILRYSNNFSSAIIANYPNIGLEKDKFYVPPAKCFETIESQKAWMDSFAARHKFNPNVPDNWYKVTRESIIRTTGGYTVLSKYDRSFVTALMNIYPDLGLRRDNFKFSTKNFYKVFRCLAKQKEFDAKDPRKWYSVTADDILAIPGGEAIRKIFPSFASALLHIFPSIGIEKSKLHSSVQQETPYVL